MNLNKVSLIGNLVADPKSRTVPSGDKATSITVATTYHWKDGTTGERRNDSEFHDVVAYGKLAKIIAQYLKKGDRVYLEGRLQTRKWQGKDKQKHTRTEVVASQLIMLGGGSKSAKAESSKETVKEDAV